MEQAQSRLSRAEVDHIAMLARLGLSDAERERLRVQLSNILEQFEVLQEVDTEDVPPTAQSIDLESVMRDDAPGIPFSPDDILSNAPWEEEGHFRVKAVLE